MKKVFLVMFGIFFVLFTGCSLLICLISGIPSLDQPAASVYLIKSIIFAFGLPLVAFGFFAHNFHLRHLLEQKDQKIREFQEKILEHQAFAHNNSNARYSREFKDSLNYLFCAFAEDTKLTEQERKELIKFIDEL